MFGSTSERKVRRETSQLGGESDAEALRRLRAADVRRELLAAEWTLSWRSRRRHLDRAFALLQGVGSGDARAAYLRARELSTGRECDYRLIRSLYRQAAEGGVEAARACLAWPLHPELRKVAKTCWWAVCAVPALSLLLTALWVAIGLPWPGNAPVSADASGPGGLLVGVWMTLLVSAVVLPALTTVFGRWPRYRLWGLPYLLIVASTVLIPLVPPMLHFGPADSARAMDTFALTLSAVACVFGVALVACIRWVSYAGEIYRGDSRLGAIGEVGERDAGAGRRFIDTRAVGDEAVVEEALALVDLRRPDDARRLLARAALKWFPLSTCYLATLMMQGKVREGPSPAWLLQRVIERGGGCIPQALLLLGDIYYFGVGEAEIDFDRAFECFSSAADRSRDGGGYVFECATYKLAACYANGLGVRRDVGNAIAMLSDLLANPDSLTDFDRCRPMTFGVICINRSDAAELLSLCHLQGHPDGDGQKKARSWHACAESERREAARRLAEVGLVRESELLDTHMLPRGQALVLGPAKYPLSWSQNIDRITDTFEMEESANWRKVARSACRD